jgi:GT2 family glycosyltransferase
VIVVNLPQFPFRGIQAPNLWMFYKALSSLRGDTHYFVHQDYMTDPSIWAKLERWELHENSQRNLGYQIPAPASLANASCSLMPDELFGCLLARAGGSPLKSFEQVLLEVVPDLSAYYRAELEALLKEGRVDAILSPINCPSLQEAARLQGIPLIHFELGPLRGPDYIDLAYFDFQGLNEKAEFAERYAGCKQKVGAWNSMGLAIVRKQYLRGDYWVSTPSARATKFDVGLPMQIEDDTNLIASSNGFSNQGLIAYSKLKFPDKRIAYKAHPGSFFDIKSEKGGVVDYLGTDFLFDCDAILTINSSMGFEALLWGKQAYVLGSAAYAHIATMSDEEERNKALRFYLGNYLVPLELVFSREYINFRLTNPNERKIEKMHLSELVRIRTEEIDAIRTERDGQIVGLNETVTEHDGQIVGLNETVTERDGQIVGLNETVTERDGQIVGLNETVTERDGQIVGLNQSVTERDGQISSLSDETVQRGEWALRLDAELKEERAKLLAVTRSNSWRLTLPLREARRWVSSPMQQAQRYTKISLRLAKQMYQSLPLSFQTKAKHRQPIAKIFPRLLQASGSNPETIPAFSVPRFVANQELVCEPSVSVATHSARVASLAIPVSDSPLVSVIIPIYGKIDYTLRCLDSIAAHLPQTAFEVIVVDDCSPDDSFDVLSKVKGIRLLRNEQNQGFIRSCNIGAKAARGEYLYFLNNDTEVTAGWMDELLRTFSEFSGTGLAGSKLIYPDGRLQEAGGIIWQDGSAWNFGRFQDPLLPVYNYAREVDYCSGASIMVSKGLFNELGGFDEHYLPAYCEDSDLALKIRDKGYRVIYQPLSTVIHFEGITSGTDTTQGTKAYQVENSKKLFERWQHRLQTHQAPGTDVDNAKDRRATRRVLVLDHCTPTPNQDAGSVTAFNLLLLLREMDFQVTFIPENNFLYMPEYTTALQRAGIEVLYAPYTTTVDQHLEEYGQRYDLAFLFRPGVVERDLKAIRKLCPQAKMLFHTVDLHFLRMSREAELQSDKVKQKAADEMKQRELAAIRAVDASIVHSTAELELLRPLLPDAKLHVFPLIMDIKGTSKTFAERRDIVFIGGYQHTPNGMQCNTL